jgi:prefoldin subunit 2
MSEEKISSSNGDDYSEEDKLKEQKVVMKYRQLHSEYTGLVQKIVEIEDEKKEHVLVMETIGELEDDRKCYRLVNGILIEKNKIDLVPDIKFQVEKMEDAVKQLTEVLRKRRDEMVTLESK